MPYIAKDLRDKVDSNIDELLESLKRVDLEDYSGICNYIITRILTETLKKDCFTPVEKWSYSSLADVIKTLECAKLEIYTRLVRNYEDKAIEKNGDLPNFS